MQLEGQSTIRRLLFLYGWRIKESTDGAVLRLTQETAQSAGILSTDLSHGRVVTWRLVWTISNSADLYGNPDRQRE